MTLFARTPALVGVVHLLPLPGAPRHVGGMARVLAHAVADAEALIKALAAPARGHP